MAADEAQDRITALEGTLFTAAQAVLGAGITPAGAAVWTLRHLLAELGERHPEVSHDIIWSFADLIAAHGGPNRGERPPLGSGLQEPDRAE